MLVLQKVVGNSVFIVGQKSAVSPTAGCRETEGSTATVGTGLLGEFGVTYQFINEATVDIYVEQNKVRPSQCRCIAY
jgi:endoglucanase